MELEGLVVLTHEHLALGTRVLDCLHRIDAARDEAARPTSDDAEDESQDVGRRTGVGRG